MGKLFERMYIGNPNKKDLTKKDVAKQSRFSLFFTVLKVRGLNLMWLNLLYSVFLLPTYIVIFLALLQYATSLNSQNPMGFADVVWYLYLLFPCMLIATPGTLGFTNVLHRWANDEHAWFSDFWTGIKKNWKQGLIVTVINYVVLFFLIYCSYFYYSMAGKNSDNEALNTVFSMGIYIMYLLVGCIFVYFMVHLYVYPMLVRYKLKIKNIYKYSFVLAFRNILGSVVCVIGLAAFLYFCMVVPYMMYVIPVIGIVLPYLAVYVYMGGVFNKNVFIDVKDY